MITEDVVAISDVLARYALTLELEDAAACGELFTADATYRVGNNFYQGRGEIVSFLTRALNGVHHIGLPSIRVNGDEAVSNANFIFIARPTHEVRCGWYQDKLKRNHGTWLITDRHSTIMGREEGQTPREEK